jgi:hypothetical protein
MGASKSLMAFIFCCMIFIGSPFLSGSWNKSSSNAVISWDTFGYWFYLPSFFYDDLSRLRNYDRIQDTYHPASDTKDTAYVYPATGRYVMNYSCGQAIVDLPAFAIGHLWARAGGYPTDGFSFPYQISLAFWCVILSCFAIWVLRQLLLRYFVDNIVAYTLIILCLGTNYLNYVVFCPMTHAFLFAIYASILYLTDSFYADKVVSLWRVIFIGLLSGLITIIRPTEIICVLIPILWGVGKSTDFSKRIQFLFANKMVVPAYILSTLTAALPQLLYWKRETGHWLFFSYHGDDKTFSFLSPHVLEVLFSYKKGWFMYTPVMILAMLGFYQLYRYYRPLFWSIAIFTVVNIYLISAWDCWWYGGSFTMRPMIQSYPLLMFPLAAFLSDLLRRKVLRYIIAIFLVCCIGLNLFMTYQANFCLGIIDGDNTTKAYYWRIFGKTSISPNDRKSLDTDEEMPEGLVSSLHEVYHLDTAQIQTDTMINYAGRKAFMIDGNKPWTQKFVISSDTTIHKGWYRVYADIIYPSKEWNVWAQTQFNIGFYSRETVQKLKLIRIQRITDRGYWQTVYIDIHVPHTGVYDSFAADFWNTSSPKPIYITNIRAAFTPLE